MHSLQLRFMAMVIAGATLFAALAGAFAYRMGYARAIDHGRATIGALADAVEKTAAIGAFSGDRVLLQEVIDGLAGNPLVASVEVNDASGGALARRGSATAPGRAQVAVIGIDRRLASPFDKTELVGLLHIEADPSRMQADARSRALELAGLMVGQTVLVALLLYVVAALLVSRPILQLGSGLRGMEPGTSERLPMPSGHALDEIGDLTHSANALLEANQIAMQRERELRSEIEVMEAQYRQIFDFSSAGIFVLNGDGQLINSNPTALRVIGLPIEQLRQLRGNDFMESVFARPDRVREMMEQAVARNETVSTDLELLHRSDHPRWVHCLISVQSAPDTPRLIEGVMYDITERKRAEHGVQHRAEHDGLTGLKNRDASEAAIDRFVAEARANGTAVTVLYIDLDGFKQVNDTLGHKAGDQVLLACAHRMQQAVRRTSDVIGRMGGDEFVIALNNIDSADAVGTQLAAQLLAALAEPITVEGGYTIGVGASIGMASFPRHGSTRKQLLHTADAVMYEVKRNGKNAFAMALEAAKLS